MNVIKRAIKGLIREENIPKIKRVANRIISLKKDINSIVDLEVISNGYHTTCGYYDWNPIKDGKLLYLVESSDLSKAQIIIRDVAIGHDEVVAEGAIANWQQGNRLRWLENGGYIYNDYRDGKYISVERVNGKEIVHSLPIYDTANGYAISLDFNRLGYLRPGYGYTKLPFSKINLEDTAITIFELQNDQIIKIIKYKDIISELSSSVDIDKCYINHVSISPDGKSFLFFFIEIRNKIHMCYLCVFKDNQIKVLEESLSASHYTWMNNERILATEYDEHRNCGYYIYSIKDAERNQILPDILVRDGHPTFITPVTFVTDTYPDKAGYQRIHMVNIEKGTVKECLSIYSTAKHMGVERCDLHPRFAKETNQVFFDADVDGHRRLYSFKVEDNLA